MSTTFLRLVFESAAVVVGRVTSVGPPVIAASRALVEVDVERALERPLRGPLRVDVPSGGLGDQSELVAGEEVLLFLERVTSDGLMARLAMSGEAGKWPLAGPSWLFSAGHVQPREEVLAVVEALLAVEAERRPDARARALAAGPFERTDLGRIAALDFAVTSARWEGTFEGDLDPRAAQVHVVARNLVRREPLDRAAEVLLLHQGLDLLPRAASWPRWVEGLASDHPPCRSVSIAALASEAGDDLGFEPQGEPAERARAVERWRDWLAQARPRLLRDDAPRLLAGLRDPEPLRRAGADLLLTAVAGEAVGFDADGDEEVREPAARRREEWWKATNAALDRPAL